WSAVLRRALAEYVNDIVVGLVELGLREEREQAVVAAVAVHDQDLLAAVAGHLVGGFLQERELQVAAVGHSAGLVLGLGDLAEVVFGENDGILLFGGVQRSVADVEKIGAERQMWTVLFQDSEGEQAGSLRTVNAFAEVGGGEFFPVHGDGGGRCGLRVDELGQTDCDQQKEKYRNSRSLAAVRTSRLQHSGIPPGGEILARECRYSNVSMRTAVTACRMPRPERWYRQHRRRSGS